MNYKRKDILELYATLNRLAKKDNNANVTTMFTVVRNINILQPEIDAYQKAIELRGKAKEYEDKRVGICAQYCELNGDGHPIIDNGTFKIKEDLREEFNAKILDLQSEMSDGVNELIEHEKTVMDFLNGEVDIDLRVFNLTSLPDDFISMLDMAIIDKMGLIDEGIES